MCVYTYILRMDEFKIQRFKPFLSQLTLEASEQVEISQTFHFFHCGLP